MTRRLTGAALLLMVSVAVHATSHAQPSRVENLPSRDFPPAPGAEDAPGFDSPAPGFGNQGAGPRVPPQPQRRNFADELTDFGVAPRTQMQVNVGTETPTTIPGGHVITTAEMTKAADLGVVIVDVLAGAPHASIPGALLMPGAGNPGSFSDTTQTNLWNALKQATDANPDRPIAFLCAGSRCWESYNAALRAEKMGFKVVLWYRGGLAAWQAAGLPMTRPGNPRPASAPRNNSPGFGSPG